MKNTSWLAGVWVRGVALAVALSLCACSALQIDVDVYKGPLANHEDVQLQQFAALAVSARPIIVALRNAAIKDEIYVVKDGEPVVNGIALPPGSIKCDKGSKFSVAGDLNTYLDCKFKLDVANFLNQILKDYEDDFNVIGTFSASKTAPRTGYAYKLIKQREYLSLIVENKNGGIEGDKDALFNVIGLESLYEMFVTVQLKYQEKPDSNYAKALPIIKKQLNGRLINFAEKILFVVNNRDLANLDGSQDVGVIPQWVGETVFTPVFGSKDRSFAKRMAVLQALGNTIIVHADDLRKRDAHDKRLVDRKDSELLAAQLAFSPGGPKAFDIVLREVKAELSRINRTIVPEEVVKSAAGPAVKSPEEIDKMQRKLASNAATILPKLAAFRTVVANFDTRIAGVPPNDIFADGDRAALKALVTKINGKKAANDVLKAMSEWFTADKLTSLNKLADKPEIERRKNAKQYLEELMSIPLGIADDTATKVLDALKKKIEKTVLDDVGDLIKQDKGIADAQRARDNDNKLAERKDESSKQAKIIEAVTAIRETVLQQADSGKVNDLTGIRDLMIAELDKRGAGKDADAEKFKLASPAVANYKPLKGSIQQLGQGTAKNQKDVLDDVIAELRQQQLQATSAGETATAENIQNALKIAYEQRAGLAYLRPASTYLRNAYPSTSIQDGNGSHSNLLTASLFGSLGAGKLYDKAFAETKLEIDKQFWQTINTVKLSGGGSTEFAVVKDDVGNWYVKGYGSDPESIIKSAQGLALFNKGGRIDVNLLGQLEDRRALAKPGLDSSERDVIQKRLDNRQSGSGANTAGLAKVLDKFRSDYVRASTSDVKTVTGKLDQLPIDIGAAWNNLDFGDAKVDSLKILNGMLSTNFEFANAKKDLGEAKNALALAATPATQASSTAASAGEEANIKASTAIIGALQDVRTSRSQLVKAINQNDALIATQATASAKAKKDLEAKTLAVATLQKAKDDAENELKFQEKLFNSLPNPATGTKSDSDLNRAKADKDNAQTALDDGNKELAALNLIAKTADEALILAKNNRLAAARRVALLSDVLIETTTSNRLDAVKAYETAIGFVGQTAVGQ